jgi:DNA-binding Lrp family transcriptional regulator
MIMTKRGWPAYKDRILLNLYEQQIPLEEIAEELGMTPDDINQRLRELDRRPLLHRFSSLEDK